MTTPNIEPKVAWAIKARRFIALREDKLFSDAIAEASGQIDIVNFLQAYATGTIEEIDNLAPQLTSILQRTGHLEEGLTVILLTLDVRTVLAGAYINYPFEQQMQMREIGIQSCRDAIQISQKLNDKPCQAIYSELLANAFWKSRQLPEAEHFGIQALQLFEEAAIHEPDIFTKDVAAMLNALGNTQRDLRKLTDAEKLLDEALQIYRSLVLQKPSIFNKDLAMALNNLGNVQRDLRKLPDARKSFAEALEIRQELAKQNPHVFKQYEAMTLYNLGNVQSNMGDFKDAKESYIDSLEIREELNLQNPHVFDNEVARTLDGLGSAQYLSSAREGRRNLADAEKSYSKALQIRKALAKREPNIFNKDVAATLNNLGTVQLAMRQLDTQKLTDAENSFTQAFQLYQNIAEREPHIFNQNLATTLNNLGYLKLEQGRFNVNKLDEAKKNFESARDLMEGLRAKAITIDDRHRILQAVSPIYTNLLACYIRMKDWKKALEIAELGKSRSLSDLLNLKSEDLQPKASTPDTLAIVEDLGKKYSDAIKELQQIESYERYLSEQLSQFENDIKRIENDEDGDDDTRQSSLREIVKQKQTSEQDKRKFQDQRFAKQSELKSVLEVINKYDKDFPPKAKEIDADGIFEISKNQNRTIVMFRILRESTAVIFVFPTGELHVEEIKGFGEREMFELFLDKWLKPYLQWRNENARLDIWRNAIEQTLEIVYEKLIIHVHQVLKEKSDSKEVLFVPNQSLALLPLHAASWKDEAGKRHYLLEEYTISYAPSVSVFKRCQENEKQRSNKTLFVTNPGGDLASSEEEVEFIQSLHQDNKNLSKENATKSAVIEALKEDYGFTHFSCHGSYNQWNPFESGLQMFSNETIKKPEAVIKLSEIINSNLQSNWLTTLSACETGMVDFASPTDEHFGLPLGFIFAGSPSVWASLWSVSDSATSHLMQKAYENLSRKEYKNNKPEALRQAQLSMLNVKGFAHPFFWAGFQHFGA